MLYKLFMYFPSYMYYKCKHDFLLDEEITIIYNFCKFLKQEIINILPLFLNKKYEHEFVLDKEIGIICNFYKFLKQKINNIISSSMNKKSYKIIGGTFKNPKFCTLASYK